MLLTLSDELLLLIVKELGPRNLDNFRLAHPKLRHITPYQDVLVVLPEDETYLTEHPPKDWHQPPSYHKLKHLTVANRSKPKDRFSYDTVICQPHSYRILRWQLLFSACDTFNSFLADSPLLRKKGYYFDEKPTILPESLVSFTYRHAIPISMGNLGKILTYHSTTLRHLEISMICPPETEELVYFDATVRSLPKLESLIYHGLSHTEPIPMNMPPKEGRFRMIRPIFRLTHPNLNRLVLTQNHCISQIGKTPLINGRTKRAFLCDLDEILVDPSKSGRNIKPVNLNPIELELGGFELGKLMNLTAAIQPKVQIGLASLNRLVLKECNSLAQLLRSMQLRKDEIQLKEVAFEVMHHSNSLENFEQLKEALKDFMTCFKGLELFSLLWTVTQDHSPPVLDSSILKQHAETLKAWLWLCRRDEVRNDIDHFLSTPVGTTSWLQPLGSSDEPPQLEEIAIHLDSEPSVTDYPYPQLRLLSRIPSLKTVHVRQFPQLDLEFWRDVDGSINSRHTSAEEFAEQIALPFHSTDSIQGIIERDPPEDEIPDMTSQSHILQAGLDRVMQYHLSERARKLHLSGAQIKSVYKTATPRPDITRQIIKQRTDMDPAFAHLDRKVSHRNADSADQKQYDDYVKIVKETLGTRQPTNKPQLDLLIVGDWRYRDQMNLSGPRTWDPNSWCLEKAAIEEDSEHEDDMDDDDEDDDGYNYFHAGRKYKLRDGFRHKYDVSLLPIFYRIKWNTLQGDDGKWRWKANAIPLSEKEVTQWRNLPNARLLDFAFQK